MRHGACPRRQARTNKEVPPTMIRPHATDNGARSGASNSATLPEVPNRTAAMATAVVAVVVSVRASSREAMTRTLGRPEEHAIANLALNLLQVALRAMDQTDHEILYQLQLNGRLANNELADLVGLTPSPCHRRVRLLEEAGVIERFTAVVEPESIGRGYEALVWVTLASVNRKSMEAVEAAFERLDEVTEAHRMMGQPDYLLRIAVPDAAGFEAFYIDTLAALPEIQTLTTMTTMKTVKRHQPLRALPLEKPRRRPRRR